MGNIERGKGYYIATVLMYKGKAPTVNGEISLGY